MNNLCEGCKWYYYVRGWNPDDPNATCRHERDNSESTQSEEQLNVEVME